MTASLTMDEINALSTAVGQLTAGLDEAGDLEPDDAQELPSLGKLEAPPPPPPPPDVRRTPPPT
jgi:hypothetical protein